MPHSNTEVLIALLQPLLKAFEVLTLVARHFHPPRFASLMGQIGTPDEDLRSARERFQSEIKSLRNVGAALDEAGDCALQAFAELREVAGGQGDIVQVFRAFRFLPRGFEALYPLAGVLPPVNQFFVDPALRSDAKLLESLARPALPGKVGVMQYAGTGDVSQDARGGFALYVPENYTEDHAWPLVVALHGGSGNGAQFLWSWLRDARSSGSVLVAPTSVGSTWALTGEDLDTPNLSRILEFVQANWKIDASRIMLTGMSDGGTFTYVSGLAAGSPFTHLAPVSAAFHPLLVQMVEPQRLRELPIHIVHGALDWMFPASMAREAGRVLSDAGARVIYREIVDLSHTYPREINASLLAWMNRG